MAKVHFVQKARKDNSVVKAGESYYWWAFRYGGKHLSKIRPRQSQLTGSTFLSTVWATQEVFAYLEGYEEWRDAEELVSMVDNAKDDIQNASDEAQDSFDNMPEGLQQGPTGEMLEERVSCCEDMIMQYEDVDLEYDGEEVPDEGEIPDEFKEWMIDKVTELQEVEYAGQ